MPEHDEPRLYCLFCQQGFPGHVHPLPNDTEHPSPLSTQRIAGMAEYVRWRALTPREKCDEIVDTYPPGDWMVPEEHLNILAVFLDDAAQWLRIVTVGQQIGVDVPALARRARALRQRHARWKLHALTQGDYYPHG
jgi:hypothetical protein